MKYFRILIGYRRHQYPLLNHRKVNTAQITIAPDFMSASSIKQVKSDGKLQVSINYKLDL